MRPAYPAIEKPRSGSCCLYAGRRLGSKRVAPRLIPRQTGGLGFDVNSRVSTRPRQRTLVHRSSSRPAPDAITAAPFPTTFSTTVFSQCRCGRFEASPRRATSEGQPLSLLQHRSQQNHHQPSIHLLRSCSQPVLAHGDSVHAQVLRPRGVHQRLTNSAASDVAFRVSAPRRHPETLISRLNSPACTYPCQRFTHALTDAGA
jgi:hypothetical protein